MEELTESQKEEARRAVLWAAEQRWKSAIPSPQNQQHSKSKIHMESVSVYSMESSSSKSRVVVPEKATDRAIWRGTRRGRKETTDRHDPGTRSQTHTAKTTTTAISSLESYRNQANQSQKSSSSSLSWRRRLLLKPGGKRALETHADAWMCGVCGKAFTTFEAADVHEEAHIRQIVSHLPWVPATTTTTTTIPMHTHATSSNPTSILRHSHSLEHALFTDKDDQDQPEQQTTPLASNRKKRQMSPEDHWEEAKIPEDELVEDANPLQTPRRQRIVSYDDVPLRIDPLLGQPEPHEALLLSRTLQESAILADEGLVQVCNKAAPLVISEAEQDAEWALACLARDKEYYDYMAERERARRVKPSDKYRSSDTDWLGKVQNKFVDAYQLMKDKKGSKDEYARIQKEGTSQSGVIQHNAQTLYLNVMVKNNIRVVRKELERLAHERWERAEEMRNAKRFERFRAMAHVNMVRIAGLALANDFTPRRVAVQLSNDLHRLLTPRLRRRGVSIETGIEYRVGPYFVIAINITQLDWEKLIKSTYKEVAQRKQKWHEMEEEGGDDNSESESNKLRDRIQKWPIIRNCAECFVQMSRLTRYEVLAQLLAWCYHLHWVIYQPICLALYYTVLGHAIRQFILSSAADEIFYYIERKGMEMEMEIRQASTQAAFMLSALREIRADGQELKKKRQQTESQEKGNILGPLLGPAIKADKESVEIPEGFEPPENLEYLGLELDLPVGFRRLRWALLHKDSSFITEAVYRTEAKYDNITMGEWNKHSAHIGAPILPPGVDESDFVGAEKEASYLMPRSAFVKANMCSETQYILAYNDYCFCLRKKALTPDVPYGSTFIAWTQYLVINTGNETCKLYCSVEPEFPNGPPLVSRQIKSGMRAGVSELFVLIGETITKYADEFP